MGLNLPKPRVVAGQPVLWKRFAAFVIDFFILDMIIGPSFQKFLSSHPTFGADMGATIQYVSSNPRVALAYTLMLVMYGILAVIYFSVFESKLSTTPGKLIFGIYVRADQAGFLPYLIRSVCFIFLFPFFVLLLLDPIYILVRKDSRRLSELLSKTATVQYFAV